MHMHVVICGLKLFGNVKRVQLIDTSHHCDLKRSCICFTDAALVLLWSASAGRICLRAPQAGLHVDV